MLLWCPDALAILLGRGRVNFMLHGFRSVVSLKMHLSFTNFVGVLVNNIKRFMMSVFFLLYYLDNYSNKNNGKFHYGNWIEISNFLF